MEIPQDEYDDEEVKKIKNKLDDLQKEDKTYSDKKSTYYALSMEEFPEIRGFLYYPKEKTYLFYWRDEDGIPYHGRGWFSFLLFKRDKSEGNYNIWDHFGREIKAKYKYSVWDKHNDDEQEDISLIFSETEMSIVSYLNGVRAVYSDWDNYLSGKERMRREKTLAELSNMIDFPKERIVNKLDELLRELSQIEAKSEKTEYRVFTD